MKKQLNFRQPPELAKLEEEVLKFWEKTKAFEKSVEMRDKNNAYVFYDGPPFATGLPHYGHLLSSTNKDVIPRYQTMRGKRVERVWGWDCHGLPIENMIEKKLEIKGGKKGIEVLGIDKFNSACRNEVLRLDKEWEKIIARLGRWVDFEHNYKTMDTSFMESVWWGFKQLYDKDLVYQGKKVILYCPRCSTALSNFEIAMDNSYKNIKDISVIAEFKITNAEKLVDTQNQVFALAWTTTPWTLPGNLLLAVNPKAKYCLFTAGEKGKLFIAMKDRLSYVLGDSEFEIVKEINGQDLVNLNYEPLFPYFASTQNAFRIAAADFVTGEDGTGIVHIAPGFGEDDYALSQREKLETILHVNEEGKFISQVTDFAGTLVKSKDDHQSADIEIIKYLAKKDLLWSKKKITHAYPHCYRCETPLLNYALPAWFINIQKFKNKLIENNETINWYPEHLKHGRFLKGLENAPDWNISRSRYWGTPMPIFRSEDGQHTRIIGSIKELQNWTVDPDATKNISDIHREFLDDIEVWLDEDKTIKGRRIPEVFDCWVESGSMPFASVHYPFENKAKFEQNFPAQFVSEYIAQTRAWFYTMHVMSTGVFGKAPFENVLTTGTILAQDGSKMSKSKNNYPDPMILIDKYGVDSLRLYLMSSTVMKAENLNFSEKEVADIRRKVFVIFWNILGFYQSFADKSVPINKPEFEPKAVMDKWLLSRVEGLILTTTKYMDAYDVVRASRVLIEFVDELSTWYLRLSRDRLRAKDNQETSQVFGYAIYTLAQLMAPLSPFFSELVHHTLVDQSTSIHHTDWPIANSKMQNNNLETAMQLTKKIVELGRANRKHPLRQPLAKVTVKSQDIDEKYILQLEEIIMNELNVKEVLWIMENEEMRVEFDENLTSELEAEGQAREVIRNIMNLRKKAGCSITDTVKVQLPNWPKTYETQIKQKALVSQIVQGSEIKLI